MTEKNETSALVEKKISTNEPRTTEPEFRGPVKSRSCTDIVCCIIFIIFIACLAFVAFWAYINGDIRRVFYPTDSKGQVCGIDLSDRPYLLFFDLIVCLKMGPAIVITGCPTPQVCVKQCPDYYLSNEMLDVMPEKEFRSKMICKEGQDANQDRYKDKKIEQLIKDSDCAPYLVKSVPIAGRCMPKAAQQVFQNGTDKMSQDGKKVTLTDKSGNEVNSTELLYGNRQADKFSSFTDVFRRIMNDLAISWPHIVILLLIACCLSLLYLLLLRCFAKPMVWITLCLFLIIFLAGTIYAFVRYAYLKNNVNEQTEFTFRKPLDSLNSNVNFWLAIGIIAAVLLGLNVIILLFLRKRIQIATAIIDETSKAISYIMSVMFFPILPFILEILTLALFISVLLSLSTVQKPEGMSLSSRYNETDNITIMSNGTQQTQQESVKNLLHKIPCDPLTNGTAGSVCHFVKYGGKKYVTFLQIYNAFMFFWIFNFVAAFGQCTVAGVFSSYYFTFNKPDDIPACALGTSIKNSLLYHSGTLALGALLIAILQMIRVLLEYIDAKTKNAQNSCASFILKCCKCCFWCLEKFLKFMNKNVYIMVAIYGQNFCAAAKNAYNLIFRNLVRVVVIDKVTDFVLFIGKLVVVGLIGALSYFLFDGTLRSKESFFRHITPDLNFFFIPLIVVIIGSYIIASIFFDVYEMGVDTIFLCFLEDLERHDGSPDKPYFMNKELMKILGKANMEAKPEGQ